MLSSIAFLAGYPGQFPPELNRGLEKALEDKEPPEQVFDISATGCLGDSVEIFGLIAPDNSKKKIQS